MMIVQVLKTLMAAFLKIYRQGKSKYKLKKENPTIRISGDFHIINSFFGSYNYILGATVVDSKLGDYSYVANESYIRNSKIGKFTCIGPNVKIGLGEHPSKDFISIHPVFYSKASQIGFTFSDKEYFQEYHDTSIGNDVWIGANAIIKGGVNIGDGAIVASGAIVSKDVPAYSIYGGVPAKFIKNRFTKDEIEKLITIQWWEKDINWLKENYKFFHSINRIDNLK